MTNPVDIKVAHLLRGLEEAAQHRKGNHDGFVDLAKRLARADPDSYIEWQEGQSVRDLKVMFATRQAIQRAKGE